VGGSEAGTPAEVCAVHLDVYGVGMSRTNIDIDDDLVAGVMRRYGLSTKKDAVDFALRQVSVVPMTTREMHAMRGSGWGADLEDIRSGEGAEVTAQWGGE
jgi:Arc/MetJ family transcription regulator